MQDESLTFTDIIGRIIFVLLIYFFGFMVALNHNTDSNQETEIKELKQKIEIIELNKKLLKLKEVK